MSTTEREKARKREWERCWRKAHPEESRERARRYRAANRDKENARARKYHKENREKALKAQKTWRQKNLEREAERRKQWAIDHPETQRKSGLKKRYGMTVDQWDALFEKQRQKCACCGASDLPSPKDWHTDHDHETGVVRGILCRSCNHMLGAAKEEPTRLQAGIAYLAKHAPFKEAFE